MNIPPFTEPLELPVVTDPRADSTADTVTITWTKPQGDGMSGYHLQCSAKNAEPDDKTQQELLLDNPDSCEAKFEGLKSDVTYVVNLSILCGDVKGDSVTVEIATSKGTVCVLSLVNDAMSDFWPI